MKCIFKLTCFLSLSSLNEPMLIRHGGVLATSFGSGRSLPGQWWRWHSLTWQGWPGLTGSPFPLHSFLAIHWQQLTKVLHEVQSILRHSPPKENLMQMFGHLSSLFWSRVTSLIHKWVSILEQYILPLLTLHQFPRSSHLQSRFTRVMWSRHWVGNLWSCYWGTNWCSWANSKCHLTIQLIKPKKSPLTRWGCLQSRSYDRKEEKNIQTSQPSHRHLQKSHSD